VDEVWDVSTSQHHKVFAKTQKERAILSMRAFLYRYMTKGCKKAVVEWMVSTRVYTMGYQVTSSLTESAEVEMIVFKKKRGMDMFKRIMLGLKKGKLGLLFLSFRRNQLDDKEYINKVNQEKLINKLKEQKKKGGTKALMSFIIKQLVLMPQARGFALFREKFKKNSLTMEMEFENSDRVFHQHKTGKRERAAQSFSAMLRRWAHGVTGVLVGRWRGNVASDMNTMAVDMLTRKHQRELSNQEMDGSSRLMLSRQIERQMRALTILKSMMGAVIGRSYSYNRTLT